MGCAAIHLLARHWPPCQHILGGSQTTIFVAGLLRQARMSCTGVFGQVSRFWTMPSNAAARSLLKEPCHSARRAWGKGRLPAGCEAHAALAPGRALVEVGDGLLAGAVVNVLLNLLPDARQREQVCIKQPAKPQPCSTSTGD